MKTNISEIRSALSKDLSAEYSTKDFTAQNTYQGSEDHKDEAGKDITFFMKEAGVRLRLFGAGKDERPTFCDHAHTAEELTAGAKAIEKFDELISMEDQPKTLPEALGISEARQKEIVKEALRAIEEASTEEEDGVEKVDKSAVLIFLEDQFKGKELAYAVFCATARLTIERTSPFRELEGLGELLSKLLKD